MSDIQTCRLRLRDICCHCSLLLHIISAPDAFWHIDSFQREKRRHKRVIHMMKRMLLLPYIHAAEPHATHILLPYYIETARYITPACLCRRLYVFLSRHTYIDTFSSLLPLLPNLAFPSFPHTLHATPFSLPSYFRHYH